ncbi:Macrolide export ATP-binding/permease protein MacB [Aquisphaera giovannonii]|uniref:Macrolide export ATP-binding/permease protein MacB n=1 Tax=Aquisphaera giovannonii TaxID=406548 RepID=A0A5B9W838_9BACT|nr:ABC transporter ATP-binding protein [Aquisphaera giovannonii]QEH36171.1 Macrolide export ATP-binding/permease protein MacB [Aquisphaera giovannonii]
MLVLEAQDVRKTYREGPHEVPVLRGVSLALSRREVVAMEGPSGSGKTTLLCILGCLLGASGGAVRIDGREVDPRRPGRMWQIRRRSIGFVFQQYNLFPSLTARENVVYSLNIRGWRGAKARREADRVLDAVGLSQRKDFRPRDLSGGQKQRVAIARALAGSAPLILADEPTGNLDAEATAHVLEMFRRLAREEDRALLIVTHDPSVRTIADRVVSIRDGALAGVEA